MALTKQPHHYIIITDKQQISFDEAFTYNADNLSVTYNHLEKVFSIGERDGSSNVNIIASSLDVTDITRQEALVKLLDNSQNLIDLAKSNDILKHFDKNERHSLQRTIELIDSEEQERMLFSLFYKLEQDQQNKNPDEQLLLEALLTMDKYRSDKLLTMSVFRTLFEKFLTGAISKTDSGYAIMKLWDCTPENRRHAILVKFLNHKGACNSDSN